MDKYIDFLSCGKYDVKEDGSIHTVKTGHESKFTVNKKGYLVLSRFRKSFLVHRLVAKKFIPNPHNLPEINHKDGDKTNNHKDNLEWNTAKQNKTHAMKNGLFKVFKGDENGNARLNSEQVKEIKKLIQEKGMLGKEIAILFNTTPSTISAIKHKRLRKYE